MIYEIHPDVGWDELPIHLIKQLRTDLLFKTSDGFRDGLPGDAKSIGGLCKVLRVCHGCDVEQLGDVHAGHRFVNEVFITGSTV